MAPPPGIDACVALFAYSGVGATLVRRLKYANHRDAMCALTAALALAVDEVVSTDADPIGVVTWVPTTARRERARGYDQARLVAAGVARHLGLRARSTLARDGDRSQTGSDRVERLVGPPMRPRRPLAGTVVLVDDVRTTGASLATAAAALRSAGASSVFGATLAITPSRRAG